MRTKKNINRIGDPSSMLTNREKEVLLHVQMGRTNKEIAQRLCITCNTVKTHMDKIFNKLNVNNRIWLAVIAACVLLLTFSLLKILSKNKFMNLSQI
jgi:DNA-binding NarL/FixJ family response regulator